MNFLRTLLIVFFSKCTILHSRQQCTSVPTSQHLPWHLLFPVFFYSGHSKGIRWHFIVVLICISLVISDSEHLFICLYALCISSLQKCLLKFSAHFWILLLSCTSPLYLSDIDPLLDTWFENIFFYSVVFSLCWLFLLLPRSFKVDVVSSVYFCFCYLHFSCHILPNQMSRRFPPYFL